MAAAAASYCSCTSARSDAAAIVDRVLEHAGWPRGPSPTADRPFPWCPAEPFDAWVVATVREARRSGLDEETAGICALRYGTRTASVLDRIRSDPKLAQRIVPDAPFCRAEIVHAVRQEMARTLDDVVRRRIPLLLVSRLTRQTLGEIAALAGESLGWSDARRREEVEPLLAGQAPPTGVR